MGKLLIAIGTFIGSSTFDSATSWNRPELNPLLRGPQGTFSTRGVVIKSSVVAGIALGSYHLAKRHPQLRKPLTITNFTAAGFTTGVAIRNLKQQ